ncbi:MAG TPA: PLDc N-terminal domain-containing protein [Candidatus Nanoarchaeia archaeon]|nr:PLDc N-terminal domain-containing protein [Candidatus Nanoarchaeia archaeon]
MNKTTFKYLIPAYILWFFVNILLFIYSIISGIGKGGSPNFGHMAFFFLSHIFLIIVGMVFTCYMLVDCAIRNFKKDSQKTAWVIIIFIFNILGAIIYYYVHGKKQSRSAK